MVTSSAKSEDSKGMVLALKFHAHICFGSTTVQWYATGPVFIGDLALTSGTSVIPVRVY